MKIHALLGEMRVCCRGNGPAPRDSKQGRPWPGASGWAGARVAGWTHPHALRVPEHSSFPTFHRTG